MLSALCRDKYNARNKIKVLSMTGLRHQDSSKTSLVCYVFLKRNLKRNIKDKRCLNGNMTFNRITMRKKRSNAYGARLIKFLFIAHSM